MNQLPLARYCSKHTTYNSLHLTYNLLGTLTTLCSSLLLCLHFTEKEHQEGQIISSTIHVVRGGAGYGPRQNSGSGSVL